MLQALPDVTTQSWGPIFTTVGRGAAFSFRITPECTALVLLVPLVLLASGLIVFTRAASWRVFTAVAAMWLVVTVINELRLASIGLATLQWGVDPGYQISHTFVGSVIGIAGFVAGLAVLLRLSVFRSTTITHSEGMNS